MEILLLLASLGSALGVLFGRLSSAADAALDALSPLVGPELLPAAVRATGVVAACAIGLGLTLGKG